MPQTGEKNKEGSKDTTAKKSNQPKSAPQSNGSFLLKKRAEEHAARLREKSTIDDTHPADSNIAQAPYQSESFGVAQPPQTISNEDQDLSDETQEGIVVSEKKAIESSSAIQAPIPPVIEPVIEPVESKAIVDKSFSGKAGRSQTKKGSAGRVTSEVIDKGESLDNGYVQITISPYSKKILTAYCFLSGITIKDFVSELIDQKVENSDLWETIQNITNKKSK